MKSNLLIIEKNLKKNVCVYICLNHFAVHLKLTQHCKSIIFQYFLEIYNGLIKFKTCTKVHIIFHPSFHPSLLFFWSGPTPVWTSPLLLPIWNQSPTRRVASTSRVKPRIQHCLSRMTKCKWPCVTDSQGAHDYRQPSIVNL